MKSLFDPPELRAGVAGGVVRTPVHDLRFNRLVPDRPPLVPGVLWAPVHRRKNCGVETTGEPR